MHMSLRFLLGTAASALILLGGCKTPGPSRTQEAPQGYNGSAKAQAALDALRKTFNPYQIQDAPEIPNDCGPYYMPADPAVAYRGLAVMFHGFSACPQQYYEISLILAKKGYASFVPLLPGHGRTPIPDPANGKKIEGLSIAEHYGTYLPHIKDKGWHEYLAFVAEVNRFAQSEPGDKAVMGLSVGGSLATYAYIQSPGLYRRALLTSPFYGVPAPYIGRKRDDNVVKRLIGNALYDISDTFFSDLAKSVDFVSDKDISWGSKCYAQTHGVRGELGRRGICDFKVGNLGAVHELGGYVVASLKNADAAKALPQVQYVSVEWDGAADTGLMRRAMAYQRKSSGEESINSCWYPKTVPHSLFSRQDLAVLPETPWLNSYLRDASNFIAYGDTFKTSGEESEEVLFDEKTDRDSSTPGKRCLIEALDPSEIWKVRETP